MRIYSTFKDYYDCLQSYDDDLVYNRVTSEIPLKTRLNIPRPKSKNLLISERFIYLNEIVGFCGKLYYRFRVVNPKYGETLQDLDTFKLKDINNFVREKYSPEHYRQFCGHKPSSYKYRVWRDLDLDDLTSFLANPPDHNEIFDRYKCPIFSYSPAEIELTINPHLKSLGFQSVFGPYEAFQELSMYVGNIAFPNKPIPHVSDEDMLEAKGFNRFSFRKDKKNGSK